jgi:hypothetical protein
MDSPLLCAVQEVLLGRGMAVLRFNFPYREAGRRLPDRPERLAQAYRSALGLLRHRPAGPPRRLFAGGHSMGGRIASHLAAGGEPCAGLVLLAYPLHPARRPQRLRSAHLHRIGCPLLFVQGTRDPLCDLELLRQALGALGPAASLHRIEGAGHSLQHTDRRAPANCWQRVGQAVADWIEQVGR